MGVYFSEYSVFVYATQGVRSERYKIFGDFTNL